MKFSSSASHWILDSHILKKFLAQLSVLLANWKGQNWKSLVCWTFWFKFHNSFLAFTHCTFEVAYNWKATSWKFYSTFLTQGSGLTLEWLVWMLFYPILYYDYCDYKSGLLCIVQQAVWGSASGEQYVNQLLRSWVSISIMGI